MAGCLAVTLSGLSCGSSPTTQSSPAANQISGGSGCSQAERQDLTFSGQVSGHVTCSTSAAACLKTFGIRINEPGLSFPLNAQVASRPVQLLIVFGSQQLGELPAGPLGDNEKSSTPQGVTLDGTGHWGTPTPPGGGTMSLAADDAAGASGSLHIKLTSGAHEIDVNGTWRCMKATAF